MAEMKRNAFKAAIGRGEVQRGVWCTIADPAVAEMLAGAGYDWVLFDTEHSAMDENTVIGMLRAAAAWPVSSLVRPSRLDPAEIKKLLDGGAQTILVPYVQTVEEARLAAASVAYPPAGIRGVAGITRASGYGRVPGYHLAAREEICLILQIETKAGMDRIEEIAAVPGVDALFVGPADLGASLGYPGQPDHPAVQAAVIEAIGRIRAAGKPAGILTLNPDVYEAALAAGAVFVAQDVDSAALMRGLSIAR